MGGGNVKNTIIEGALQIIAPHLCSGCEKTGTVLCDDCKSDIVFEPFWGCIACGMPHREGICSHHEWPIEKAFVSGLRTDTLETLINQLKFNHVKTASSALAELLDETLPLFPSDTQIIPIPTVASHARQRGYDQVDLIARHFAALRGYTYIKALCRQTRDTQHIADKSTRQRQADTAFALTVDGLSRDAPIILIDDIITTGSTVKAAAALLHNEGFTVWVGAVAYQPLD